MTAIGEFAAGESGATCALREYRSADNKIFE
jgi:hypothetical protein